MGELVVERVGEGLEERGVFGLRVKPWRLICGAVVEWSSG